MALSVRADARNGRGGRKGAGKLIFATDAAACSPQRAPILSFALAHVGKRRTAPAKNLSHDRMKPGGFRELMLQLPREGLPALERRGQGGLLARFDAAPHNIPG
jgi:hypothetical protein